ncbi:hypothetical protein SteCoe_29481 [Stentor coeruleus]|uniref:Uncharacterized protein n=1 Tax=Stentor coeruleus TaxID=5963 RepID=A0A1R2B5S6_9CILI|nr:hypothetical protein SteCoe_29481 [Stentor coeruleus]
MSERNIINYILPSEKLSIPSNTNNSDIQICTSKQYIIPSDWYQQYESYKKGGNHPGKIPTSRFFDLDFKTIEELPTINSSFPFISLTKNLPKQITPFDYTIIDYHEWLILSNTFGSDGEVIYRPKRGSFRSISSPDFSNDTLRLETSDIILPLSARKNIERKSWRFEDFDLKIGSFDNKVSINTVGIVSSKIGLEGFSGSDGFNSSLQVLFSIKGVVEYFVQNSETGEFGNSEFLLKAAAIFTTVLYTYSGLVISEFLHKSCNVVEKDPGLVLQGLINKIDIELGCNNFLGDDVFNGVLTIENLCLNCSKLKVYQMKFNYLNFKPANTLEESLQSFFKTKTQLIYCSKCNKDTFIKKITKMSVYPNYFMIILKRWEEKRPPILNSCKFKRKLKINADYKLISVIAELNKKYVCYSKRKKAWYFYENEKYSKSSHHAVVDSYPYVLLYKKVI